MTNGHYCNFCEQPRPFESGKANHVVHLLLSIFTNGLWLLVWFLCAFSAASRHRCMFCGEECAKPVSYLWFIVPIVVIMWAAGWIYLMSG